MTDTNPPKERKSTTNAEPHRYKILRGFGGDEEQAAEATYLEAWNFLNTVESDANRRADLWLMAASLASGYDDESVQGARDADAFIRAMCSPRTSCQP